MTPSSWFWTLCSPHTDSRALVASADHPDAIVSFAQYTLKKQSRFAQNTKKYKKYAQEYAICGCGFMYKPQYAFNPLQTTFECGLS